MKHPINLYLLASIFSLLIGLYSFRKKSVSASGLVALIIISFSLIWLDQIALLCPLFYMFASSSLLSKVHNKQKLESEKVLGKSGPRDYVQALANLGVATVCFLIYSFSNNVIWVAAGVGSVATGNADSWASEIGSMSKKPPFSILTFKPMRPGISGGVSALGTLAGLAGSLFIACTSFFTLQALDQIDVSLLSFLFATSLAGFVGMLFDSLLGVLFQALYLDPHTHQTTERQEGNRLVKGITWMSNDLVNFLSTLFGGLVAAAMWCLP